MAKIKQLYLRNYCGYKEVTFDFRDAGDVKRFCLFFGPNGIGKTSILQAINQVGNPKQYLGRKNDLVFNKLTYHPDYNPTYAGCIERVHDMYVEAIFQTFQGDKKVVLENAGKKRMGVTLCELDLSGFANFAFWVDADNPMNTQRFQINTKHVDKFLDLAEAIYGYRCEIPRGPLSEVEEYDPQTKEYVTFCTNFIIYKKYCGEMTKVHFKRMSAGERKIATLLQMLCNPLYYDRFDIFLIDNLSMHVYFLRHAKMVDKFMEHFADKQIIATDHSGVLIDYVRNAYGLKYLYEIEAYLR